MEYFFYMLGGLGVIEKIGLDPKRYDLLYVKYMVNFLFGNAKIVCKVNF